MKTWSNLEPLWQEILLINTALENTLTPEQEAQRDIWKSSAENYAQIMGHPFELNNAIELIKYLPQLKKLDCSGTNVRHLPPELAELELQELYCGRTPLTNIQGLLQQQNLTQLCLFGTPVADLAPLQKLKSLERLCCAQTQVSSLEPLQDLSQLRMLSFSNTNVSSLAPLMGLPHLKCIRCDGTQVSAAEISRFQTLHPDCEVWTEAADPSWDDFAH